jgi:arginine N-succinyltransferase
LDAKARAVLGRVGEQTKPAQHLLESVGFNYIDEVDPFDGGPHYEVKTSEVGPIKYGRKVKLAEFSDPSYKEFGLMGCGSEDFHAALVSYDLREKEVAIPPKMRSVLGVEIGEEVFLSPFNYGMKKEQT